MLLKISLGLAILAGIATMYFTWVPLKDKIDTLNANLASETTAKNTALEEKAKALDDGKKLKASLDATSSSLKDATNLLAAASARLVDQEKRANKASSELAVSQQELSEARDEIAKWKLLGIPPERVRDELETKKKMLVERDVLTQENKLLSSKTKDLQARLDRYERPEDREIELPPGTNGKIVAVDPKYDFVVLDIGSNKGLLQGAKMLVNRDGKFVTKIRITHVEPNRAIANVMREWGDEEVMEQDQVVY